MRVLVTGATGFLGYHLCKRLAASGHRTTAFHRKESRTERLAALNINLIEGDLADLTALRGAIADQDVVIHSAADLTSWSMKPDLQNQINVEGTRKVALASRLEKIGRLVHVSSVCAIGIPRDSGCPADERFQFNLRGSRYNYHVSKKRAEEAVLDQVQLGLDAVIVNPGAIFGENGPVYRQRDLIYRGVGRKIIPCFSGGICAVHIDDVVDGILAAVQRGVRATRYILGGDNISFREIARRSLDALQLRRTLVPVPVWSVEALMSFALPIGRFQGVMPGFAVHFGANLFQYYSSEEARRVLNYRPRGFEAIVEDCLNWSNSARKEG